jgi:hypothetical protein
MESEKPEKLSRAAIHEIAQDVREGEASPKDARSLLECFCGAVDDREAIPPELLRHLRDAFRAFLNDEKTIEAALGIARKTGRPRADPEIRMQMAEAILRLRLDGMAHQEALSTVSEQFGWGETIVAEAWRTHQQDAIVLLDLEHWLESDSWTPQALARLEEIFTNKPGHPTVQRIKARRGTSKN